MPDYEIRTRLQRAAAPPQERTITGIAFPYGTAVDIGGYREMIAPGAVDVAGLVGLPVAWRHDEPIGRVEAAADTPAGPEVRLRIADTQLGGDALALAREDILGLSIGFDAGEHHVDDGTVVRDRISVREISLTHMPAYSDARVLAVRELEEPTMTDTTTDGQIDGQLQIEVRENHQRIQALEARSDDLAALVQRSTAAPASSPLLQHRSFGDYVIAAYRDPEMVRALADQITGNNPGVDAEGWVKDIKGIVDKGRPFIQSLGGAASLPDGGLSVAWPTYSGDLAAIFAEQAAQKTDINSVRVDIAKATGDIKTLAAGSDVALQLIERSDPSYLDALMRIYMAAYAYATNLDAVLAAEAAAAGSVTYDPAAPGSFFTAVVEANIAVFDATGRKADVVAVRTSSYAGIAGAVKADGEPMYPPASYGTVNAAGRAGGDRHVQLEIDGTAVIPVPGLSAPAVALNSEAFRYHEDGPKTLDSIAVSKLGRDVGVYGYVLGAPYVPAGIVAITQTARAARTGK